MTCPLFFVVIAIIEIIQLAVFFKECIDFFVSHRIDNLYQIADPKIINGPTKLDLCFDFVAFRHPNVTHVVAKTSDFNLEAFIVADCHVHPSSNFFLDGFIFPITDNDFVLLFQTGIDKSVFSVTMSRLVQVHKVHIDGFPWNLFIVLSGKVQQWFL